MSHHVQSGVLANVGQNSLTPKQASVAAKDPPPLYEKETLSQDHVGDPCADGHPGKRGERPGGMDATGKEQMKSHIFNSHSQY